MFVMANKSKKRTQKRGSFLYHGSVKLTPLQKDVLHMITEEYLTTKQIAKRRKTTLRAVQKIVKRLKEKGLLSPTFRKVRKDLSTIRKKPKPLKNEIRLHGQEINIEILYKDEKYETIRKKSNFLIIDGNRVKLYRNSLEAYLNASFMANDCQTATSESLKYIQRFIQKLESHLSLILIKSGYSNIKIVKQHYAETKNELAKEYANKTHKLRVKTTEDGKTWFLIDNSFNLHEAETQHTETAKQDMEHIIQPFFNDLRDNKPPVSSEVWKILNETVKIQHETASAVAILMKLMTSNLPSNNKVNKDKSKEDYIG